MFTHFNIVQFWIMNTTQYVVGPWLVGLALRDLPRLLMKWIKIHILWITYWKENFNCKAIQSLCVMLQQKIHFWHFKKIFVLEAMLQISIYDS